MRGARLWPLTAAVALAAALAVHGTPSASPVFVKVADATPLDGHGWVLTADSAADGHGPELADDGDAATDWESAPGAALPQALTLDTGAARDIAGLRYTPPPLG